MTPWREYEAADFYAGLRHYPLVRRWWFSRGVGSNKKMRRSQEQALRQDARDQTKITRSKTNARCGNNVGEERSRKHLLCQWLMPLVRSERPQLPSEILKRLNFFGFKEANVSHFVSQPV